MDMRFHLALVGFEFLLMILGIAWGPITASYIEVFALR